MTVKFATEPIPSAMGKGNGGDTTCNGESIKMLPGDSLTWSCKLAVGRDITLTWRVRGGRAAGMPVVVSRTVPLYAEPLHTCTHGD